MGSSLEGSAGRMRYEDRREELDSATCDSNRGTEGGDGRRSTRGSAASGAGDEGGCSSGEWGREVLSPGEVPKLVEEIL